MALRTFGDRGPSGPSLGSRVLSRPPRRPDSCVVRFCIGAKVRCSPVYLAIGDRSLDGPAPPPLAFSVFVTGRVTSSPSIVLRLRRRGLAFTASIIELP